MYMIAYNKQIQNRSYKVNKNVRHDNMKVGIIGYGSMGKMLLEKFIDGEVRSRNEIYIFNRTQEKISHLYGQVSVCKSNEELAKNADIVFICVRPGDIRAVIEEIKFAVKEDAIIVSLNGSVTFEMMERMINHKIAKVIPSITAEINQSQTLVCYNGLVKEADKTILKSILKCLGNIIELPEKELGMGSELVSCMPGFIASIFDVICDSAKKHTDIPEKQIIQMVLNTLCATGELMIEKEMSFENVVTRVATKGGITEEGSKVIYDSFPKISDEMFEKTLEKRTQTAKNVQNSF